MIPIEIFVCYARKDEKFVKKIKTHLNPLQRQGRVNIWHDRNINAGIQWQHEIDVHLNTAQIILLLVSPDFMASNYCYSIEMKRAMERHESGEARVVPIILRPLHGWEEGPFGKLQALPTDASPVTKRSKWRTQDDAFFDIAKGIHRVVELWEESGGAHPPKGHLDQVGTTNFSPSRHKGGDSSVQLPQQQQVSLIEVMISSTTDDLFPDRDAIIRALKQVPFVNVIGAESVSNTSYARRSRIAMMEMAEKSDLFILLLSGSFGLSTVGNKPAIEVEFEAAYKSDPTKILAFQRDDAEISSRQRKFLKKISRYYKGDWITKYKSAHDLHSLVIGGFTSWIKERASVGHKLTYLDHFVRFAIQRRPISATETLYSVNEDYVELKYKMLGKTYILHLGKEQIYGDFWKSLSYIDEYLEKWEKERHGRDF
jgi:hypothetical protein